MKSGFCQSDQAWYFAFIGFAAMPKRIALRGSFFVAAYKW